MTKPVSNTEERLAKWYSFVNGDSPDGFMFHVNFPVPEWEAQLPAAVPHWPDRVEQRIERRWAEYELMCRKTKLVDDDRVPYLSNVTGTEIFAESFGCAVHRPHDTNPFALPLIHRAAEADALKTPELSASSLACLLRLATSCSGAAAVMC